MTQKKLPELQKLLREAAKGLRTAIHGKGTEKERLNLIETIANGLEKYADMVEEADHNRK